MNPIRLSMVSTYNSDSPNSTAGSGMYIGHHTDTQILGKLLI